MLQLYHIPVASQSSWNKLTLLQAGLTKILSVPAGQGICPQDDLASGAKGQEGMRVWDWVRPLLSCATLGTRGG